MPAAELVFAVHDHQPVGNFEHIFEYVYRRAYEPFLATLERHPNVKCVLHRSGVLWEWLERRHPEHLDDVGRLVERGQVELLTGAYYEPLLPSISERDRRGQIAKLTDYLEQRFGVRPRGCWVAERVWEPQLTSTLAAAGVDYTFLDDAHFEAAGIGTEALDGWYLTHEAADDLAVLPIHAALRYRVPFASPEDALAAIEASSAASAATGSADARPAVVVLADDGEKFGAWPGTHVRCYEEKWLEQFFVLLESSSGWLRSTTASACLEQVPVRGRTPLPAAAYPEFEDWALDPASRRDLHRLRLQLGSESAPLSRRFLRGGSWRHFLERYPESHWMHQRVAHASESVWRRIDSQGPTPGAVRARDEIWRAQCNCAYWHGLFGGVYLAHLRSAIYGAVLRAERWLTDGGTEPSVEIVDLDSDGAPEIVLRSRELQAFVTPDSGGAIVELDDRVRAFNLIDTMARREEADHASWLAQLADAPPLVYDEGRRGACVEHVLAPEAALEDFSAGRLPEIAAFAGRAYEWAQDGEWVRLHRAAPMSFPDSPVLHIEKRLRVQGPTLEVHWTLWHDGDAAWSARLGLEVAVNLLAGDAPDRYYAIPGHDLDDRRLASTGTVEALQRIDLVDEWQGLRVRLETDAPGEVWRAPLETLSSSENGPERVFQGSLLLFVSPLTLAPGARASRSLTWTLERT